MKEQTKNSAPAATDAEKIKKEIMSTKELTSDSLKCLSNSTIALKVFYLIDNSSEKHLDDFIEIGKLIGSIGANLKSWKR